MLRLLPLSYREISKTPQAVFPWERRTAQKRYKHAFGAPWESFLRGGYPELQRSEADAALGIRVMSTYLERTSAPFARSETSRSSRRSSARGGEKRQLLTSRILARDLGLRGEHGEGRGSRSWRRPSQVMSSGRISGMWEAARQDAQVYFADVAPFATVAGLKDAKHAMSGPMGGHLETAVGRGNGETPVREG